MTGFLLAISIGPVQEFIAAGRRTSDLYAGSQLIALAAQIAAKSLEARRPGCLVFPADSDVGAANKILAEVPEDPAGAASAAEIAARNFLRDAWQEALASLTGEQRSAINSGQADQQISSFLDWYAAWQPRTGDYAADRRSVDLLLAGRKALREFKQPQKQNVWKSPLDPSRDTVVLGTGNSVPQALANAPIRLKGSEWLDAVSVLKRLRGTGISVPSTADIAARTFLADKPDVRAALRSAPERAVYKSMRQELKDEGPLTEDDCRRIERACDSSDPNPYFAILQADGDGIGAKLAQLGSADEHRGFSRKLQEFALSAKEIVARKQGCLVYAGGDDVLAFLPLHSCLGCAAALASAFRVTACTLSVGIGIVHYHEPLHASLSNARATERAAKEAGGNRLCVGVYTRGGGARHASLDWGDTPDLAVWRGWVNEFLAGNAAGLPYEVERLAMEVRGAGLPAELLRAEVKRILARKKGWKGEDEAARIAPLLAGLTDPGSLHRFSQELVVFRWTASHAAKWNWEDAI